MPVGCVFVRDQVDGEEAKYDESRVVAEAHNLTNRTKNASTHCEVNCIRKLSEQVGHDQKKLLEITRNCSLYVTCEPCLMCAHALNIVQIKRVVFGCHNDKFGGNGSILSLHLHPKSK